MPAKRQPKPESATDATGPVWSELANELVRNEKGVRHGRMMSSDAVTFAGKVFAFHTTKGRFEGLGLRLGREYDVDGLGLASWESLAPFRSKPPMKDWILVGRADAGRWPELARLALERMRAEVRGGTDQHPGRRRKPVVTRQP